MSEWITDRLPTKDDAVDGRVLITSVLNEVYTKQWENVQRSQPWQRLPAPYVKPKRWTVKWFDGLLVIREYGEFRGSLPCYKRDGESIRRNLSDEFAQKIEDIYNEVMQ